LNEKLIIKTEGLPLIEAMPYVLKVIEGGLISTNGGRPQYCWITTFGNPLHTEVFCTLTKNGSHSFTVTRLKP